MNIKINLLELASEMAHRESVLQTCIELAICEDDAKDKITEELQEGVITYKEEYQDRFNQLYDEYYERFSMLGEPVVDNVEEAKDLLKKNGYQTYNLWHIDDVKSDYECSDEEAHEVLVDALQNDATMEQIWFALRFHADEMGLERKEEEDE